MSVKSKQEPSLKLEQKYIVLEPFTAERISEDYLNWFSDPEVCQFNSHGSKTYTREEAEAYVRQTTEDDGIEVFAIIWKDTGDHIGNISLGSISLKNLSADINILIGNKDYWNRGDYDPMVMFVVIPAIIQILALGFMAGIMFINQVTFN